MNKIVYICLVESTKDATYILMNAKHYYVYSVYSKRTANLFVRFVFALLGGLVQILPYRNINPKVNHLPTELS